jgi:glycosyltransferase involved in cell wall biosynthesis
MLAAIGVDVLVDGWRPSARALALRRYTGAFVEFWHVGEFLLRDWRRSQLNCPVVVDTVDLQYMRERRAAAYGDVELAESERTKGRELAVYHTAEAVVVITPEEDEILRREGVAAQRFLIPIIVPLRERSAMPRNPEVVFVGGFDHRPNVDGVLWFVNEIWNTVQGRIPEARLKIVGSNPPPAVLELKYRPGVDVTGHVPDTGPYLDQATVSVAPLRYGAGMKGKVAEALAAGVPVITTSIGAEGFGAVPGEHLVVANSSADFAAGVVEVLESPGRAARLGRAGQALVAGLCGPDAVAARIEEMIDLLVQGPPAPLSRGWLAYSSIFHAKAATRAIARKTGVLKVRQLAKMRRAPGL